MLVRCVNESAADDHELPLFDHYLINSGQIVQRITEQDVRPKQFCVCAFLCYLITLVHDLKHEEQVVKYV